MIYTDATAKPPKVFFRIVRTESRTVTPMPTGGVQYDTEATMAIEVEPESLPFIDFEYVDDVVRVKSTVGGSSPDELWNETDFVAALYALSRADMRSKAIDLAMEHIDQLLSEGRYLECNRTLRSIDPSQLKSAVAVSILGITRKADHLPARREFFDRAFNAIAKEKGRKYAKGLLEKYR